MIIFLYEEIFKNMLFPFSLPSNFNSSDFLSLFGRSVLVFKNFFTSFITPQPLRAVGVLFSPMVSGWAGGLVGGGKKFVRAVSQKP